MGRPAAAAEQDPGDGDWEQGHRLTRKTLHATFLRERRLGNALQTRYQAVLAVNTFDSRVAPWFQLLIGNEQKHALPAIDAFDLAIPLPPTPPTCRALG